MKALVGYTGFVGSNLFAAGDFDTVYNSSNIEQAYGTKPDLLVYAGLRAEKYLADRMPERDMEMVMQAKDNIVRINPRKLVLISTIDVFKEPKSVDERSEIDVCGLHPYGYNRYQLEFKIRESYQDALIIRLPALFGRNIKKNFIYDYINVIPFMLKKEKMESLCQSDHSLKEYYTLQDNGFYKLNTITNEERILLRDRYKEIGFTALNFTDSRSRYQFYNLSRLWSDMNTALDAGIRLWHPATEPVSAGELYQYLTGRAFINELEGIPADYDYRSVYSEKFGGSNGYIDSKEEVMKQIEDFVKGYLQE